MNIRYHRKNIDHTVVERDQHAHRALRVALNKRWAPSTPATMWKQHCRMVQSRMLLRQVERCFDIVVDRAL